MRFPRLALAALPLTLIAHGPAAAGLPERVASQQLLEGVSASAAAVVHPASGVTEALRGLDEPLVSPGADPAAATLDWLRARATAFGLDPERDELRLERQEPLRKGGTRLLFRQHFQGVPVAGGDVRCVVSAGGRLLSVASACVPGVAPVAAARVSADEARAIAAGDAGVLLTAGPAAARLWVRRERDGDRLEWEVRLPLAAGRPGISWVDAADGAVRARDEGIAHAVGNAFPTDPRAPEAEVPLARLLSPERLRSQFLSIWDALGPQATPVGPGGDFRYPSSTLEFDQVNAYWHCDRYLHDFLGGLGYAGPPDSVIVRVHYPHAPWVAVAFERYVHLGQPIPGYIGEVSRCHDVIYHELTHVVLYGMGIQPGGSDREASALHEGIADYLSAAFTGDPALGEWLYLAFPNGATRVDQPVDPWHMLNYDQLSFGAAPPASSWANSMILSSALWDLRARLGSTADSLVLEALDHLPTVPLWSHLANALLQADGQHHAGRWQSTIAEVLLSRGIRGSAVAGFIGPNELSPGEVGTFRALPCCGPVQGAHHWRARPWCRGVPCGEWRALGQGDTLRVAFEEDTELAVDVFTPWGNTQASRFVSVRTPRIVIEGPTRVARGSAASWRARVDATGPWRVEWQRLWRRTGALPERIGASPEVGFAVEAPCELSVKLTDGIRRTATSGLSVDAFADQPVADGGLALAVTNRLDAGASFGELRVSVGRAGTLRAVVYDVRGRERKRLWDGPAARGAHTLRWDARGLEPGVYLLRVRFEDEGALARFIVLR